MKLLKNNVYGQCIQMMTENSQKLSEKLSCKFCDYFTYKKSDYNKHLSTRKHLMMTENSQKLSEKVACTLCDYITYRKSDYIKHLSTRKHLMMTNIATNATKVAVDHICSVCNLRLCSRQSLWRHYQSCKKANENIHLDVSHDVSNNNLTIDKELFYTLIKDNQEFKQLLMEQNKQIINYSTNSVNNSMNICNNNNNTVNNTINKFNLNFFLNEQCKDAMNLSDFVDSINVSLKDLEYVGEHGYVNGITKIIMDNLNQLDLYKRPIHCTDIKREVIHIKDNDKWEKDTHDNEKLKRFIASVGKKNSDLVPEWQIENPECAILDSPKYNQWLNLAMRSYEYSKEQKNHEAILRNIVKKIYLDKNEIMNNMSIL